MVVDHAQAGCMKSTVFPHAVVNRKLRKYLTFLAPLTDQWKLFAGCRGSNAATYTGGVVTGAGAVYYADSPTGSGLLAATTSGAPVFTSNGYQALGAISNVLLRSNDFTNAAWTDHQGTANVTGPDGAANSAYTLTDADAGVLIGVSQAVTCPNDSSSWTMVLYFKKTTSAASFPGITLWFTPGTSLGGSVLVNTDTGVLRNRLNAGPVSKTISDAGSYWRVSMTVANNSTGNTALRAYIYPAASTDGTQDVSWTAATTGSCVCYGASLWNGAFAYPGVLVTQAVAASRSADVLTYPVAGNFNATSGSLSVRTATAIGPVAGTKVLIAGGGAGFPLYTHATLSRVQTYDGTTTINLPTGALFFTTGARYTVTWGPPGLGIYENTTVASGAFDGDMTLGAAFTVGGAVANATFKSLLFSAIPHSANDVARLSVQP